MVRLFFFIVLLFCANVSFTQNKQIVPSIIIGNDTVPHIWLKQADIIRKAGSTRFIHRQNRRNIRLEYNVRKVYPYARIAAKKVNEIEHRLSQVSKESERKKIIKEEYSQLMKTFKTPLTQLTITQGRILIRLIYRETSHTSFAHIREYRGTVNAYFWQSIALIFGNNLKAAYDPYGEDAEIEAIVQKILAGY